MTEYPERDYETVKAVPTVAPLPETVRNCFEELERVAKAFGAIYERLIPYMRDSEPRPSEDEAMKDSASCEAVGQMQKLRRQIGEFHSRIVDIERRLQI